MDRSGSLRGQSEVLGVVLLLGLSVASVGIIATVGGDALDSSQNAIESSSAEHAMMELDSKVTLVAHGDSNSQRVTLPQSDGGSIEVDETAGWMNVTIVNRSTGDLKTVITNMTMGSIVYTNGPNEIAYQNGGVWRYRDGGSVMVSPPEVHYRGSTLTLPMVAVEGEGTRTGNSVARVTSKTTGLYPNGTHHNPLTEGKVNVTVKSRYYQGWASYFRTRTGGSVSVNHTAQTATLELVYERQIPNLNDAARATDATGTIDLAGSGAYTDSYNSSEPGGYSATKSGNGTIQTAGSVYMAGGSEIRGNVRSGDFVEMDGTSFINGSLYYTSGTDLSGDADIAGSIKPIHGVEGSESVNGLVGNKMIELGGASSPAISGETELDASGDGLYYYSNLIIEDTDKLILNTTEGNIEIAVDGPVTLEKDSNITVVGDNMATIYMGEDFTAKKGSSITVSNETATRFWIYGTDDAEFSFGTTSNNIDQEEYVGVFYAPGGQADIYKAQLYGSLVAGDITIHNEGRLHFDESLKSTDGMTGAGGSETIRITYLHISRTNVTLDD